jgi:hypothetical protein
MIIYLRYDLSTQSWFRTKDAAQRAWHRTGGMLDLAETAQEQITRAFAIHRSSSPRTEALTIIVHDRAGKPERTIFRASEQQAA